MSPRRGAQPRASRPPLEGATNRAATERRQRAQVRDGGGVADAADAGGGAAAARTAMPPPPRAHRTIAAAIAVAAAGIATKAESAPHTQR